MKNVIIHDNEKYFIKAYNKEEELTDLFTKYSHQIISESSFWIKLEKKFKSKKFKNFKESIGDGFLLVWDNPTTPSIYITEVELESHDINKHILPQLGNFISFVQSSTKEEKISQIRDFLYNKIKKNRNIFKKIRKDTKKEVHELLDNALEELQILLVIDKINPQLSTGLSHIERAIKVKIRKIEVSLFVNDKNRKGIIQFSDSEIIDEEKTGIKDIEEYSLDYHLEGKPGKIVDIMMLFLKSLKDKKLETSPMKHYIGISKNNSMIFSIVPRKNSIIFYSKATVNDIKINKNLSFRDVRKIGHYTNHLPTEIVITETEQLGELIKYFDKVYKKY